jgi:hypothetical protein
MHGRFVRKPTRRKKKLKWLSTQFVKYWACTSAAGCADVTENLGLFIKRLALKKLESH